MAQNQTNQDISTPGILEHLQRVSFGDAGGNYITLGVVMLVCYPIPWEAERGGL